MIGPTIMDKLEWDNSLREIYVDQVSVLENMTDTDAMIAPCLQQAREELASLIATRAGYDRCAVRIQSIVRGMATRNAIHFAMLSPDPDEFRRATLTLDAEDDRYQNTLIYGIQCMVTGEMYVGGTTTTLEERMKGHRTDHRTDRKVVCTSNPIIDRGNYKAYEIQRWPCKTRREALKLEGDWQRAYKASFGDFVVNKRMEGQGPEAKKAYRKEYRETHKEERSAYGKEYRETRKEEKKAYDKVYLETHKEEKKANDHRPWTCEWCDRTVQFKSRRGHQRRCKLKPISATGT